METTVNPDLKKAHELRTSGQLVGAADLYREVLKRDFGNLDAWYGLGLVGYEKGNYDLARDVLWRVLQVAPGRADVWTSYGRVLGHLRQTEEAEKAYQKAIVLNPYFAMGYLELGLSYLLRGLKDEGVRFLEMTVALSPDLTGPYLHLANEGKLSIGDERFLQLERVADDPNQKTGNKRAANYALAKVYENARNYEKAFHHFSMANQYSESPESNWKKTLVARTEQIQKLFTPAYLARRVSAEHKIFTPIFIVGMPRSGTTLTDQIFGTHSQVYPGDELPYLFKYLQRVTQARTRRNFPEGAGALLDEDFAMLARLYQLRVRQLNATKLFITDKMPWNFQAIGVLYKAMPWAKVIHIHRNPVDCGFSNFRSPLSTDIQYASSFEGFAFYRRVYKDVMDFWRATVPGFFLDLCYEELVENPEREIRRILDFCGLPWEDGLLAFHTTKREIRTISRNQVNKPLNRESIGYEKKYGKLLDPLKEALRAQGLMDAPGAPGVSGSARP